MALSAPNLILLYIFLAASSCESSFLNLSISNGLLTPDISLKVSPNNVPISSESATNAAPAPKPPAPIAIVINLSLPVILLRPEAFSIALPNAVLGLINLFALAAST